MIGWLTDRIDEDLCMGIVGLAMLVSGYVGFVAIFWMGGTPVHWIAIGLLLSIAVCPGLMLLPGWLDYRTHQRQHRKWAQSFCNRIDRVLAKIHDPMSN